MRQRYRRQQGGHCHATISRRWHTGIIDRTAGTGERRGYGDGVSSIWCLGNRLWRRRRRRPLRRIGLVRSDTNGDGAWLLEQLSHGIAAGLPRRPASHPLTDLAFVDGIVVTHQLGQGVQEFSEPRHALRALSLTQADRL